MREPRNPFRLRASEHIESDETFVRLFSPDVLDILRVDELWEKPQIIRSAPGGGKTSLFRLFTPRSLLTVHALRTRDYSKDLFRRLTSINAIDENGPCVLGVLLSCSQSYATLDDLDIDCGRKQRLLLSLLNARFVLSALQGALLLKRLSFPHDLKAVDIDLDGADLRPTALPLPSNGQELYDWAMQLEKSVCEALDSFAPLTDASLPGHDSLLSLKWITARSLNLDGEPIVSRVLLMLDDLHGLTSRQRRFLLDEIISNRFPITVWIAERLEALDVEELLSSGASSGRDYDRVITIEDYWRGSAGKRFEKVVANVADRRARDAKDVEMGSFAECLQESLDGTEWQDQFRKGAQSVADRVREKAAGKQRYVEWIKEREDYEGSAREIAIAWRALEILIDRDIRRVQKTLFDMPLSAEELQRSDVSAVQAAAELFYCREFKIPYYFGLSRLATMASKNIEQFLWLAGDLFEESVSAVLLKRSGQLSPASQERILKKAIKDRWAKLPQQIRHGTEVCRFLEAVGKLARWETDKPNAPYAPGVTGIAISMSDREKLSDQNFLKKDESLLRVSRVLSSCIAHNLCEVTLNQKCKGQYWMVLNLNRMLCVHFGLPLQYGGWREKSLRELCSWLDKGFAPPRRNGGMFS